MTIVKAKFSTLMSIFAGGIFIATSASAGKPCAEIEAIKNRDGFPQVTIQEIMDRATKTHPQVLRSQLAYENAMDDIRLARSVRFPQISLNYDMGYTKNPVNTSTEGRIRTESVGLSVNQLIYDFGVSGHQIAAAHVRAERAQATVTNQQYQISMAAAESYLDVLQQRIALDFALEAYKDFADIKHALIDSGVASETDVNLAWQNKEGICSSARVQLKEHEKATHFFQAVINTEPENLFLIEPHPVEVVLNIEESMRLAAQNNPAFEMATLQIEDARESVSAAERSRLPKASLSASTHDYEHSSSAFGDRERDGGYVGVRITAPVFTGGKLTADINKAKRNERMAKLDSEVLTRNTRRVISDLIQSINTATSRLSELQIIEQTSQLIIVDRQKNLVQTSPDGKKIVDSQNLINLLDERGKLYKVQVEINTVNYNLMLDRYSLLAQQGRL